MRDEFKEVDGTAADASEPCSGELCQDGLAGTGDERIEMPDVDVDVGGVQIDDGMGVIGIVLDPIDVANVMDGERKAFEGEGIEDMLSDMGSEDDSDEDEAVSFEEVAVPEDDEAPLLNGSDDKLEYEIEREGKEGNVRPKRIKAKKYYAGLAVAGTVLFLGLAILVFHYVFYQSHFLPGSYINGKDVSKLTAAEAVETLKHEMGLQDYVIRITDKDGVISEIHGKEAGISLTPDIGLEGTIQGFLKNQKVTVFTGPSNYETVTKAVYDEEELYNALKELPMFTDAIRPSDSYISAGDDGHEIVEENEGNFPLLDAVYGKVAGAVSAMEHDVVLDPETDYQHPAVRSDDEGLDSAYATINTYEKTVILYDLPDGGKLTVGKDTIMSWIKDDLSLDEGKIKKFVSDMAKKYDTYNTSRKFRTTIGDTVTIGGGWYGWKLDKEKEFNKIMENLKNGSVVTREPEWEKTGYVWDDGDDIGNTYIELDYSNQHLYFYKDGTLVLDTDIVSGNMADGYGSPDGIFSVRYKQSPVVLSESGQYHDVSYFMGFAYGIGIHDAAWRTVFGGDAYKWEGSHSNVQLPLLITYDLYRQTEEGVPVVAYYREAASLTSNAAAQSNAYSSH